MVFGNMGNHSATGVAFSRNPATGENKFYGEWLVNAQGEDVVAGIRTPNPVNEATKNEQNKHLPSLETEMPGLYKELYDIRTKLEHHYKDMQDIEFTIQEGKLYMLQCRNGKRTGTAALNMAMDMLAEGLIDEKTRGDARPAGPARRVAAPDHQSRRGEEGQVVRFRVCRPGRAAPAARSCSPRPRRWNWAKAGKQVILVREETNPEDVEGMRAAEGILTARGGMTSHAALVARGWGKCCIVGAGELKINMATSTLNVGGQVAQGRRRDHAQRHPRPRLRRRLGDDGRHGEPAVPGVHEDRRQAPQAGRADQRRHARATPASPAASAPKASACSAPSTCSTARVPTSRCSCCGR